MLRVLRKFWNDQRGVALVLVAIMLPAIIGFSLLVIDMSRANSLSSDLQQDADAFSIAAAAELDGKPDSITRADRALATLVRNQYSFAGSGGPVTLQSAGITRRYLRSLPATDNLPIVAANVITNESVDAPLARFVEIKVTPVGFSAIFPVSFLSAGSADSWTMGAVSVAGFSSSVCDFTPMFICNPYSSVEALGATLHGASRPSVYLKKQTGGNNAQYAPGNYGFLQTPDGDQSTPALTGMFASTKPLTCYKDDGVDTKPGNVPPVNEGINVRFDIYAKNGYNPSIYPPAPNVRKGMVKQVVKGVCSYVAPTAAQAPNYMALPRDTCFPNCPTTVPDRIGNGAWNRSGYWLKNHGTATLPSDLNPNASRWDVYNYEITHPGLANGPEAMAPQCNPQQAMTDPKRRMIYVAIIDCVNNQVRGSGGNYPVQAFASVFLTEPAGDPPAADIWGEIVDITTRAGNGTLDNFLRDEAQIYR
ncbi:TadE/TadG family type IV pilus assembly protein [Mesorhizobium sp. 128a]